MRRATLACIAVVVLTACDDEGDQAPRPDRTPSSQATSEAAPQGPTDSERLNALLVRRAAALEQRRPRAYAATATGEQRRRDLAVARNVAALPLRNVTISPGEPEIDGSRARLPVRIGYALQGVAGRFTSDRVLLAGRAGGRWRITGERRARRRLPWEISRQRLIPAGAFSILTPDTLLPAAAGLPQALDAARRRIVALLPGARLRRRTLVVVAADVAAARALTGSIRGVERLGAITEATVRTGEPAGRVTEVVGVRLLVIWPQYLATDPAGRERVLVHELTHAALAKETSARLPAWLAEGMALHVSGDRRIAEAARLITGLVIPDAASAGALTARRSLSLPALSKPDAIARLAGPAQGAAYAYSSASAAYIVTRFGERRLRRLYDAFNDEDLQGQPGARVADAAVRRVLGVRLARLNRDVRRWILTTTAAAP